MNHYSLKNVNDILGNLFGDEAERKAEEKLYESKMNITPMNVLEKTVDKFFETEKTPPKKRTRIELSDDDDDEEKEGKDKKEEKKDLNELEMDYYIEPKMLNNIIIVHPITGQRVHMDRGMLYRESKFFQQVLTSDPSITSFTFNIECTYEEMKEFLLQINSFTIAPGTFIPMTYAVKLLHLASMFNQYDCSKLLNEIYKRIKKTIEGRNCSYILKIILEIDKYRLNDAFKVLELMNKFKMYECLCTYCVSVVDSFPNGASTILKLRCNAFKYPSLVHSNETRPTDDRVVYRHSK